MTPLLRRLPPAALLVALTGLPFAAPGASAVGGPASRALADACAELDLNDEAAVVERSDAVDDVFVGRVSDVLRRRSAADRAPQRTIAHRVTVTTVLSGDLRLGQEVTVVFEPADDGRRLVLGERETHLFFTSDVTGELRADYCNGSRELPGGLSASLQRRLEDYLSGAPEPPARVALHRPDDGAGEPPRLSRVVAPGAAISLIGVLGLFLVARVGRRR